MLILAIDTTTRGGSIAVADDDTLLALVHGDATRTHGERLPGEMAEALDRAGVARSALDLLAVACGPGAFTGLRIGLAAVQGLAMTLGLPVAGVSALDALVWHANETPMKGITGTADGPDSDTSQEGRKARLPGAARLRPHERREPTSEASRTSAMGASLIAPWMDAQRGDVFAALYSLDSLAPATSPSAGVFPWTVVEPALTSAPADLLERWGVRFAGQAAVFVGDAALRDAALIAEAGAGLWRPAAPGPLAPAIARIGRRLALAGKAGPPHALTPIYVRRADAEIERERRGGR